MNPLEIEKKLQDLKVPKIELLGHKMRLRRLLLEQGSRRHGFLEFFPLWKGLALAGAGLAVLLVLFFDVSIFWQPSTALAEDIALKDSRVNSLVSQGAVIKGSQLADKKGYVLIQTSQGPLPLAATDSANLPQFAPAPVSQESLPGVSPLAGGGLNLKAESTVAVPAVFLVEIDFKNRRVSEIKKMIVPLPVIDEDRKTMIREISRQSQQVQAEIPESASIEEISPYSAELKLIKNGDEVEVEPSAAEATVLFRQDGKKWRARMDMRQMMMEQIEFLGEQGK